MRPTNRTIVVKATLLDSPVVGSTVETISSTPDESERVLFRPRDLQRNKAFEDRQVSISESSKSDSRPSGQGMTAGENKRMCLAEARGRRSDLILCQLSGGRRFAQKPICRFPNPVCGTFYFHGWRT